MRRTLLTSILVAALVAALSIEGQAQQGLSNARSVGMGGAYTALARGVEAPLWNPANLGLAPRNKFSVNLLALGIGLQNNSFSKAQYELYNGSYWGEKDKAAILGSVPAEGLRLGAEAEFQLLSLGVAMGAITVSGMAWSDLRFDRDYVDFVLNGNEFGRTYDFSDTDGRAAVVSGVGLSFGFPVSLISDRETSLGVTVRYLTGWLYGEVLESEGAFSTALEGARGEARVKARYATGGSGYAADLGAAAGLGKSWYMSVVWQNAFGGIKWTNEPTEWEYRVVADSVTFERAADVDADSLVDTYETERTIPGFRTGVPSSIRFGLARAGRRLTVAFDFVQKLRQNAVFRQGPRLSLGIELKPIGLLPLRAGVATGGRAGTSSSLGVGLHFWTLRFDAAVVNYGSINPKSGKGLGLAFGVKFQ
jgi:hypothetical protein